MKQEKYILKIKENKSKSSYKVREFKHSILNDYEKISETINKVTLEIKKRNNLVGVVPIYIIKHPEIQKVYIYGKQLWDLYFKYNIINECFNDCAIILEFILYEEKEIENLTKSKTIINNKTEIMKYIIKKISFNTLFKTFNEYLKKRIDIAEDYENFLISQIMNDNIKDNINDDNNENKNDDIEKEKQSNEKDKENKKDENYYQEYFICCKDFCNIIDNKYKTFSSHNKFLEEIKNLFVEEDEQDKNKIILDKNNVSFNYNLSSQKIGSLRGISLMREDSNNINENNAIFSAITLSDEYIKKLMNSQRLFKNINKEDYYSGIENYKDILNREIFSDLNSIG
jgi:hypothetical protein